MDFVEGEIFGINKPLHWTSFAVVGKVRWLLCHKLGMKKLRVGHTGTLDPLATGVLILCTGKMTKQIERLQGETKEYTATLQLGATTPSYDREHTVDRTFPIRHITRELIDEVLPQFVGNVMQVPPAFSAVHVDGHRAYKLRRKSDEVEQQMQAKPVRIDEIEVLDFDREQMLLSLRVVCGKGTYIRSLARDIGRALGSGAFLTALRRTRVGDIRVEDCIDFDHIKEWIEKAESEVEN
jgi:tRNA pseudouridine55 synthase